ncbi:peptidase M3A/M3B [Xylariales sp. PMI_506]|nr:peptidase M3A/M3B [Xylariales sp. PMI_506]
MARKLEKVLLLKQDDKDHERERDNSKLYAWDWWYYLAKQRKQVEATTPAQIAEYFEVWHTLYQMLTIFEDQFGLDFRKIETSVWDEIVLTFTAWDSESEGGNFLGYLYVDLFDRDGKYTNMHHIPIQRRFSEADGTQHWAVSVLVCCFEAPTAGTTNPTLLKLFEVRTLFHELGHCIHNLVARTKYAIPHSRDFVEIPSLMLENWIWNPMVLLKLGKHYTSLHNPKWRSKDVQAPEHDRVELPLKVAQSIVRLRGRNAAHAMVSIIQRALFDLAIHSPETHEAAKKIDTTLTWNTTRREFLGLERGITAEESGFERAMFGHIF